MLANWRRARGKERDALLWGDEVCTKLDICVCGFRPLTLVFTQVEYLVVAVDEEARKARLSLAQAEILKSLAKDEALWKSGDSPRPGNEEQ